MQIVFFEPPSDFQSKVSVAGCYCEFDDKILLLKRTPHKLQGDTWGIPGGKLDEGETPRMAAVREVFEEVGISLQEENLEEIDTLYIRGTLMDYTFYRFRTRFAILPDINLNLEEHLEAVWITIEEALTYPLIYGGKEALLSYREIVEGKKN